MLFLERTPRGDPGTARCSTPLFTPSFKQVLCHNTVCLVCRYQQQLAQVDAISDQAAMLQAQQEANTHNKQYRAQEQARLKLTKQMQSLLEELEITKLPPDEMQARMLAKAQSTHTRARSQKKIKSLRGADEIADARTPLCPPPPART